MASFHVFRCHGLCRLPKVQRERLLHPEICVTAYNSLLFPSNLPAPVCRAFHRVPRVYPRLQGASWKYIKEEKIAILSVLLDVGMELWVSRASFPLMTSDSFFLSFAPSRARALHESCV